VPSVFIDFDTPLSVADRAIEIRRIVELERAAEEAAGMTPSKPSLGCPVKLYQPCASDPSTTVYKFLCDRATEGIKLPTSSAAAGVTKTTVNNWLRLGHQVAISIDNDEIRLADVNGNELEYLKFHLDYRAAEAQHRAPLEVETTRAALEGTVTTTTSEHLITNPETGEVIDRVTVVDREQTTRDGKAALNLLKAIDPETYLQESPPVNVAIAIDTTQSLRGLIELLEPDEAVVFFELVEVAMHRAAEKDKQSIQKVIDV